MPVSEDRQASCARAMYSHRARSYDASWHVYQGFDFTRIAELSYGQHVLDLAAGTGLVAIPARKAVGPTGSVTAVDLMQEMLDVAIEKARTEHLDIQWHCHDIKRLDSLQDELKPGGYDVITCASALALFEHPLEVVQGWVQWLRPGGILVVDMLTEWTQVPGLAVETTFSKLGKPLPYNRTWVTSQKKFESLFEEAGLTIQKSFVATGYWSHDDPTVKGPGRAWDQWLGVLKIELAEEEKELSRRTFLEELEKRETDMQQSGRKGEEGFYVVVASKPLS